MNEYINQFKQMISDLGMNKLLIIGGVLIALIIIYFIYRSLRLRSYRKQIVVIENDMNGIKSLPLQYRLGRVQSISKNMPEYADLYDEYAKEFERISDFQKNELAVLVNEVDEQLFYGKLRRAPKKMKQLNQMLETYTNDSKDLLKKVEEITEIENVQRVQIIRIKEKYRQTIDDFETIRLKVGDYVPRLNDIFNDIDHSFVELEDLMNNQKFEEAKDFTDEVENRIDWINDNLIELPNYVTVVRQYVPKRITYIEELIESMSEEHYSLEQLHVQDRLNDMKARLDQFVDRIKNIDIETISDDMHVLVDDIDHLTNDLEEEKKAYDTFQAKWSDCYEYITGIYSQYKQALVDFNRIQELYKLDDIHIEIDEQYEEFDSLLKESYELEEEIKGKNFSYLNMIQHIDSLKERMVVHQNYLNDFFTVGDSLYMQEQRAIDELENINIVLLEIKSEIKNKHLPMINESYKDYIQDSYDKAAQIQAYRQNRPVELSELSQKVDEARDVIYKLYDNVHNLIVTAEMVEEAIVYGNRYRSTFLEVNTELTKAEVLFRNGEYTKALSTAVDIIEKIKPGAYEELIKKSSQKSS